MRLQSFVLLLIFCGSSSYSRNLEFCGMKGHPAVQSLEQEFRRRMPEKMRAILPTHLKVFFKNLSRTKHNHQTLGVYLRQKQHIYLEKSLLQNDVGDLNVQRVLWHELAHVYDRYKKISKKKSFLYLNHWRRGLFRSQLGNHHVRNLVDPYQGQSLIEAFAVGFEAFMEDPEMFRRRSNLYQFYSDEFEYDPFPDIEKKPVQSEVTLQQGLTARQTFLFDWQRFYGADYLYATPGSTQASKWGHSMIRLIFCKPGRTPSEACRRDLSEHLVVSYRADPGFSLLKPLLGIFGGYPSKIFLFKMNQMIQEYTRGDVRELQSYPLELDDQQKRTLWNAVQESYWSYQGQYRFVTNNCATETMRLLKMVYQLDSLYEERIITPKSLYKALRRHKKISSGFFQDRQEALRKSYLFPSIAKDIDQAIRTMTKRSYRPTRQKFVHEYTPQKRSAFYHQEKIYTKKQWIQFLKLEQWADEGHQKMMKNQALKQPSLARHLESIHQSLSVFTNESRRVRGYGVPLSSDFSPIPTYDAQDEIEQKKNSYQNEWLRVFPHMVRDTGQIDKNKSYIISMLNQKRAS